MNKTLAILGAGHLGQQIAHMAIMDNHYTKVVFFDDFSTERKIYGSLNLGKIDSVLLKKDLFDEVLIAIGYKHLEVRQKLFEEYTDHVKFGTIIHSTCWIDKRAEIKKGSVLYPGCFVDVNATISENAIINLNCTIAHDSIIGKHSFLSPRVAIAGFVNIGQACNLGINCTVIDNLTVADRTQLGAGTVLTKNIIQKNGLYVGTPAKKIK